MPNIDQPWATIITAAAVVTALGVLWRLIIRPAMRAFNQVDEYGPVLTEIARQFKANAGSSLVDRIEAIEKSNRTQDRRLGGIERALRAIDRRLP